MGIVLWVLSGCAAFLIARIVPLARRAGWAWELLPAIVTALLAGLVATALDFGGWGEPDWRAGVFTLFAAFAAIGVTRAIRR